MSIPMPMTVTPEVWDCCTVSGEVRILFQQTVDQKTRNKIFRQVHRVMYPPQPRVPRVPKIGQRVDPKPIVSMFKRFFGY